MTLYATRHGETEWNALNKISGVTDIELTGTGVAQAEAAAKEAEGRGINLIIASPMKRALTTAKIIAEHLGVPLETDPRLVEQNYGIYEGKDRRDPGFLANKRQFATRYPGGESMMQLAARVYPLLDEIKEKHADQTVLIVSHGGVSRVLRTYFTDMTNEEYFNYSLENCRIEEYHYE